MAIWERVFQAGRAANAKNPEQNSASQFGEQPGRDCGGEREKRVRSKSAEVLGGGSGWRRTLDSLVSIWIFFPDMGTMAGSFFKCIFIYLALPGPSVTVRECLVASCVSDMGSNLGHLP